MIWLRIVMPRGNCQRRSKKRNRSMTIAPMISYAQNHEDVLLRRAFADQKEGFYVDIGANHPVNLSITKHFYDSGWSGVNIEPLPCIFELLQSGRPRDINLNMGISNKCELRTLYEAV